MQQSNQQSHSHNEMDIKELFPALPIINKPIKELPKPTLKVQLIKNQNPNKDILRPRFKKQTEESQCQDNFQYQNQSSFNKYFSNCKCVYTRYNNKKYNQINGIEYYSSIFVQRPLIKANKQPITTMDQILKDLQGRQMQKQSPKSKNQIIFDSNFESGNLFAVYRKSIFQYDLVLQNDINSKGNTQWFYFSVTNLPKDIDVTFNIVNLLKTDSLFNYGMQPVVLSKLRKSKFQQGWVRSGKVISYAKNTLRREKSKRFFYTLSFKIASSMTGDTLYIAHCFPYTYTMLNQYLNQKILTQKKSSITRATIGKTLGNNNIQVITITNLTDNKKQFKKIILILARQHPGESQGSYVCEGIITYLLGKSKQAQFLKKNYIIKIIPMVNPDGVIVGNYRTNLMGHDLNRKWNSSDFQGNFPEVNCIKKYIAEINKDKKIKFILDLHGHSKKLNSFFYGNPNPQHPELARYFPFFCSKMNSQISFEDCTFTIEQQKKSAARIYLSLSHQILNTYTFESSFFGYVKQSKKISFGIQQYKNLGVTLCQSLHGVLEIDYYNQQKTPQKPISNHKWLTELKENPNLIMMGNKNQSGSEQNPEEFQLKEDQIQYFNQLNSTEQKKIEESKKNKSLNFDIKPNKQIKFTQKIRASKSIPKKFQQYNLLSPDNVFRERDLIEQLERQLGSKQDLNMKKSVNKISVYTQTNQIDEQSWEQIKPISTIFSKSQKFQFEYKPSFYFKDNINLKYISLKPENQENKRFLKLDLVNKPLPISRMIVRKNTYSQTFLSFTCKYQLKNYFPTMKVKINSVQRKSKIETKKSAKYIKKQEEDTLSEMMRKYHFDMKQRQLKPIVSYDEKNFAEKLNINQFQDIATIQLNVKRKELIELSMSKKRSLQKKF